MLMLRASVFWSGTLLFGLELACRSEEDEPDAENEGSERENDQ